MIVSKTPYRISFFGGGSDYPSWYLKNGGSVLSTTIDNGTTWLVASQFTMGDYYGDKFEGTVKNITSYGLFSTDFTHLRHIFFQTISFITTSGFTSTTYNLWPSFIISTLITASFIGACAGSTGGGMKVIRIILLLAT